MRALQWVFVKQLKYATDDKVVSALVSWRFKLLVRVQCSPAIDASPNKRQAKQRRTP